MNVYKELSNLPSFKNAVITIGSFDGVHTGHQKILERLKNKAREYGGESIVITFNPHPRHVIKPDNQELQLINTVDEKAELLEAFGIDHLVVVPFDKAFSQQSPEDYIERFLLEKFSPSCIVIGYDHRFGRNREGDITFLRKYEQTAGFELIEIKAQEVEDITVSSTKIRKAIKNGQIRAARQYLNHAYRLTGTVVKGQQIGQEIGYPTANIAINDPYKLIPADGIYAVRVAHKQRKYNGMLYIGTRPTLKEFNNRTIEVNIFDFDQKIYGDILSIEFIDKIRGDQHFDSLDALSQQLEQDKQATLRILEKSNRPGWPSVAVTILNYNGRSFLESFLPGVRNYSYENLRVIVADNASTDDSISFLKESHPEVERIILEENYGFAEGYNRAIDQIDADYIVLLNSDVEVEGNWIAPVIEMLEKDPSIAAVQPKIKAQKNKEYFEYAGACGGWMDFLGYPFCRGRIFNTVEKDEGQYDEPMEVFWASGAAMFVRTKLFKNLGGFDGDYFAHLEEIDHCWRLKRAGYKVMVQPKAVVYHVGGGTLGYLSPRKAFLNFRNSLFTIFKNESFSKLLWLIPARLILDGVAAGLFLTEGKFQHIQAILRAHFAFYGAIPKLIKKRKHYNDLIKKHQINKKFNPKGVLYKSIVWAFYIRKKKNFHQLKEK